MQINPRLNGRVERRLPIMIAVRLSRGRDLPVSEELAYTDNVSVHGARVVSNAAWQVGDHANITPVKEGSSLIGEVVYCGSLGDSFFVGFKFQEQVTWPPLIRYQKA
jgi:PilZ domain